MTVQPVTASRAVTASSPKSLKDWLTLTKPGITLANLLAASAGLWLGGEGPPHWTTAFWTLLGTALVVASGAALNNVVDVDIDGKMTRTRHRPLVNGRLHRQRALIVGLLLGVAGLVMLMVFIHWTAFCCAAVGLGMYAGLYSLWLKRKTAWSTVIGGVAGAMPPMVGYFAGSGGRLEWAGYSCSSRFSAGSRPTSTRWR
ncbi:hypothetical protein GCM10025857_10320 [Alicyclobacillus contaminans]|nr:hypothetical protein GCM10025857_10320 [Alicyclobacillus contaminans]